MIKKILLVVMMVAGYSAQAQGRYGTCEIKDVSARAGYSAYLVYIDGRFFEGYGAEYMSKSEAYTGIRNIALSLQSAGVCDQIIDPVAGSRPRPGPHPRPAPRTQSVCSIQNMTRTAGYAAYWVYINDLFFQGYGASYMDDWTARSGALRIAQRLVNAGVCSQIIE